MIKYILAILLPAFLLAGCPSQYGIQKPANVNMTEAEIQLANAYSQLAGARITLSQLEARKRVTPAEKASYSARLDGLRANLDLAVGTVNTASGQSAVSTALSVLLVIESELAARAK